MKKGQSLAIILQALFESFKSGNTNNSQSNIMPHISWLPLLLMITSLNLGLPLVNAKTNPKKPADSEQAKQTDIFVGTNASELQRYAAAELQRYLYQLTGTLPVIRSGQPEGHRNTFVIGCRSDNPLIDQLASAGKIDLRGKPAQAYCLKRLTFENREMIVIAGEDETGCLYGVYGLLQDYFDIRFYMGGDVIPENRAKLKLPEISERKEPSALIRGILPWTNFPQSATSYSWEDWRFIIDQMAKMRMNLLNIHNYFGWFDTNEMFHNFEMDGFMPRTGFATASSGHKWGGTPGWQVNRYLFGANDLFDDYDFGASCALHNESLDNRQVFRKGVSMFQKVIAYAHRRGVKVALGIEFGIIPKECTGLTADDPRVVAARVQQITTDYPDLDYLICYQVENFETASVEAWRKTFDRVYSQMKQQAPNIHIAVSGWGLTAQQVASLPSDVICAPIAPYSDTFENGAIYGDREYWGCPWLERDGFSSEYYYPYNIHLSNTIQAWQNRAPNLNGFFALTWRLTDAIDPKLYYIAAAPWDDKGQFTNSGVVYRDYAQHNYGVLACNDITSIINQNEPFASDFGECQWTPPFAELPDTSEYSGDRELAKALAQLKVIDRCIGEAQNSSQKQRLKMLRCRIEATADHIRLNKEFNQYTWKDLPGSMDSWVKNFTGRVCDISSLGNVVSVENRFVQLNYVKKASELASQFSLSPPGDVEARGTPTGARITWSYNQNEVIGFYVQRDGVRCNAVALPPETREFEDMHADGHFIYTVTAVGMDSVESQPSICSACMAGTSDREAPRIVMISPPASVLANEPAWLKVRLLDGRDPEFLLAVVHYRRPGTSRWTSLTMQRRVRSTFTATIPGGAIGPDGLEYYITASDQRNESVYPSSAPAITLSLILDHHSCDTSFLATPQLRITNQKLAWEALPDKAFWYCIYRDRQQDFETGPHTFLTYVEAGTHEFVDSAPDLEGKNLRGLWFYRITQMDKTGHESLPGKSMAIDYL